VDTKGEEIMSHLSIVKNPKNFRDAFFTEVQDRPVNTSHEGIINILLYYIWRGLYNSITRVIKGEGKPDLVLICISIYKAFLPLIHLIRMGYTSDAFTLMRSLMERIALLGYLNENQSWIGKYKEGKLKLPDEAMKWAKEKNLPNWMKLYSHLSNLAHQRQESVAGSIFDENSIGEAVRYMLPSSKPTPSLTDETLALLWFGIMATDPIAEVVLSSQDFPKYPDDEKLKKFIEKADLQNFEAFLHNFVNKYQ
jgi:hypothetical protein